MSDPSHHGDHVPGVNEPRELSHPLLWTLGLVGSIAALAYVFFHFKAVGREHVAGEPVYAVAKTGAAGPDHQKLIADRSQAVLDKGEVLYSKNCAACHGASGDNPAPMTPAPRNFKGEKFKGKNGSGPYGFYLVLSEGYGAAMPAFKNLKPEERYAVAHFVRETWMKPNAAKTGYAEQDDAALAKTIPAPGAAGAAAEKAVDPLSVQPAAPTYPLLAAVAKNETVERIALRRWLDESARGADSDLKPAFARIDTLFAAQPGRIARLQAAAAAQDRTAFAAALVGEDGSGSADTCFCLTSEDVVRKLYARLAETATRMH